MSEDPKSIPPSRHTLEHAKVGDDHIQYIHDQLQREKSEPSEGFTPVPIFLLFVFSRRERTRVPCTLRPVFEFEWGMGWNGEKFRVL